MNYCYNCKNWTDDTSGRCPYCGGQTTPAQDQQFAQQPMYQTPAATYQTQDPNSPYIRQLAGEILKWGIMSVPFACSFILSFLGIVFAVKAKKKAKEYISYMGQLNGKAKVGNGLALGGLIGGIVITAIFAIYIICWTAIIISWSQML